MIARRAFATVLEQACVCRENEETAIDCSDLSLPDPSVDDLLSAVRGSSSEASSRPLKKPKTDDKGLPVVTFVTGNQKKLEELERILKTGENMTNGESLPFRLRSKKVELSELQGGPVEIAKEKCYSAAKEIGGAVITEDTSLCFNALGGLPGPYIKWFLETCGHEGLNKLLSSYEDKTGYAQTVVAFAAGPGRAPKVFVGKTPGKIVMPRGRLDFGWDPIFQPDEGVDGKTYAEMTKDEKDAISHRSRALSKMRAYFNENRNALRDELE